ncbi:MAG: glycosyltransferase family 2 protein [Flavobacterium sp.]|nr:MAG: glycosyltransferase family 2 protein [Flavobacterium sp.]
MQTAVLILNYNNPTDTINCIESVLKYNTTHVKFVVVDNASPAADCVDIIDAWMKEKFDTDYKKFSELEEVDVPLPLATFILTKQNHGYAQGNNAGLRFIFNDQEVENVLVLNNDILFIADIIPQLVKSLYTLPNAAVVSPLLLKKNGIDIDYNCARKDVDITTLSINFLTLKKRLFTFQKKFKDNTLLLKTDPDLLESENCEIQLPSGACMLFNAKFFESIEGFDPSTFLYYEENILHSKISKRGMKAYLIPKLRCIHLGASTISKHKRRYEFDKKCDRSAWVYVNRYANVPILQKLFFNSCFNIYSMNRYIIHKLKNN